MIKSTDIPAARADLTSWSIAVQSNFVGLTGCTHDQSASILTDVIPASFMAANEDACTAAVCPTNVGTASPK
jgi:hypothetical protein